MRKKMICRWFNHGYGYKFYTQFSHRYEEEDDNEWAKYVKHEAKREKVTNLGM